MKNSLMCLLLLSLMTLLSCVSIPEGQQLPSISYENKPLFGAPQNITSEDALFYLTDEQKQEFKAFYHSPGNKDVAPYNRLYEFLESSTLNFNYRSKTLVANKTLGIGEGNCLSLAILATALARLVDIRVAYQLVDSTPVFEQKDEVIIKGVHVRSKLFQNVGKRHIVFGASGIIVDYFPGGDRRFLGNLSEKEFIARFYLNLAADFIAAEDYINAYWHALRALEYAPKDKSNINTMAVIYRRMGDEIKAEEIYRYGIETSDEKLTLLKNYRILLLGQGRSEEALKISGMIDGISDPSPYNWISIGDSAFEAESYADAKRYYQKAIELAPYLQYAYLGMAKIHFAQNRFDRAREMIVLAMENNYNPRNQEMYEAKLTMLAKERKLELELR